MDILYSIKKIVAVFASPLTVAVLLLIYACWLLSKRENPQLKRLKVVLYSATLLLTISSSVFISNFALRPLEESFSVYRDDLKRVDNIVILGCHHRTDPQRPKLANIHECSLSRMIEAVRLSLVYPNARIITSGYNSNDKSERSHPDVVKAGLVSLGVAPERIIAVAGSRDTRDESINLKPFTEGQINLLLSEATHLRRAVTLFEQQNINVTPVPCRYMTRRNIDVTAHSILPSSSALEAMDRFLYEVLGNLWVWLSH